MLKGTCAICRRKRSMTVSDATIEAEELKDLFESVGKATVNFGKNLANNPVRALEKAIKIQEMQLQLETQELFYQPHLI